MSRRATEQFNYLLKIKLTTIPRLEPFYSWVLCVFYSLPLISALLFEDSA